MMSRSRKIALWLLSLAIIALLMPQKFRMPVEGATRSSYNSKSYWYHHWGRSGTHKGVDIFAKEGTPVKPASTGLVLYSGTIEMGGNVVLILSAKWRLHYYAHLQKINTTRFRWVNRNTVIGTVGSTGNAAGKPPHLHFSIVTLIPYLWRIDTDHQGWKKMFYLNPIDYFSESHHWAIDYQNQTFIDVEYS